jgi:hypothetical protein
MLIIPQGKPETQRFKIFVPGSQITKIGEDVICRHPVSMVETKGIIYGVITEPWIKIPDWICLDTYGLNSSRLKKAFEKKFPEHRNQEFIKILLIEII